MPYRVVPCAFRISLLFLAAQTWCPKCAALRSVERKKLTLADMHQTARQFGGVFLSPEYHGAAVKVWWWRTCTLVVSSVSFS